MRLAELAARTLHHDVSGKFLELRYLGKVVLVFGVSFARVCHGLIPG